MEKERIQIVLWVFHNIKCNYKCVEIIIFNQQKTAIFEDMLL